MFPLISSYLWMTTCNWVTFPLVFTWNFTHKAHWFCKFFVKEKEIKCCQCCIQYSFRSRPFMYKGIVLLMQLMSCCKNKLGKTNRWPSHFPAVRIWLALKKANIGSGIFFLLDITYRKYLIEPSHKNYLQLKVLHSQKDWLIPLFIIISDNFWTHSAFSQVVILALANPKNWILATSQAWNDFIHYPSACSAWIVSNLYREKYVRKLWMLSSYPAQFNFIH